MNNLPTCPEAPYGSKTDVDATFKVATASVAMENRQFWRAIGYDGLFKLVHEPSGQFLLDRGAAWQTIKYLRTHCTFSNHDPGDAKFGGNICGRVMTIKEDGTATYDFTHVNRTFHEYVKRGMKPIVEFDFFPDGLCGSKQEQANDEGFATYAGLIKHWNLWSELLHRFMENLEETFGKDELRTWYFEIWNEPDAMNAEESRQLYRMYDIFAHTLKAFDPAYKVGGPATYKLHALKGFLDHVTSGTNHVTGKPGSPIDFVSHHLYGVSGSWLTQGPRILPLASTFSANMLWLQRLMDEYKSLKVEIHLNEWGECSHGDTKFVAQFPQLYYRNTEYSALLMVKLVDCLKTIESAYGFRTELLLFWGACFNASMPEFFIGSRDLTTAGNVPKPILTGWEMLTRLGGSFLPVEGPMVGGRHGLLAAKDERGIQLLVYNFNETDDDEGREDVIEIALDGLSARAYAVCETRLDRHHHNTYREWERLGSPVKADERTVAVLMATAELQPDNRFCLEATGGCARLSLRIPRHGMVLFELSAE
jgi:xylan 1,4-beta-xylosidase